MDNPTIRRPIRIALVGAGAIAMSYVSALERSPICAAVAVADTNRERAQQIAARLGVPAFTSHAALLRDVACDAVVVCAPPVYHMEIAIDSLLAGVHVLCEKPLSIGVFAARRMFAAADREGKILTMASKFRFVKDVIGAKALVAQGRIGDVVRVENSFMSPVDMTRRWNSQLAVSGGGVIIDNGTHSVDLMRFILGPLMSVLAVDTSNDPRYDGCDDSANLFVRNSSGVTGAINLSWTLASTDPAYLRIHGTGGAIDVGWQGSWYRLRGKAPVQFGNGYDKVAAFDAQLDNFGCAISGTGSPIIGRADAIASVQVIDAAYASIQRRSWCDVEGRHAAPLEIFGAGSEAFVS
jgi:predicted dehydrogenase